ncbi:hypothetical protein BMBphi_gp043 [Bacillus phage vB_BthS_BMBphi]|nr:hypothetical protein BMBphi_gp043 [Bacillus phage vB_BthS_BMBphi]
MRYQVYRYDKEGKFLYDDLVDEVLDDKGNRILPEGCTDIAPPPLGTEPRFRDGAWHPTKEWNPPEPLPPEPTPLELLQKEVDSLKEQIASIEDNSDKLKSLQKRNDELSSSLQNLKYYLGIILPDYKHYFEN